MKPLNFNTDIRVNIRIYKVVTRLLATYTCRNDWRHADLYHTSCDTCVECLDWEIWELMNSKYQHVLCPDFLNMLIISRCTYLITII